MGIYLNPDIGKFEEAISSEIYIDKSSMIQYTNRVLKTTNKYVCVSRPRRFGKSMAADMLSAYYNCEVDTKEIFSCLNIAKSPSFEKYLNKYEVIALNMQEFLSETSNIEEMLELIQKSVLWEVIGKYPDYLYFNKEKLVRTLQDIYSKTRRPFVFIIDEWDCIFREYKEDLETQKKYLDFLRNLLKDKSYIALAYMTGILPIKKYGTHSALNVFTEFSMTDPGPLAEYVGFTEKEVQELCVRYHMDFAETKQWYDGYYFSEAGSVYSPRSVVCSMQFGKFNNYWNRTETYEALKIYIDMNFDGLRDAIVIMLAGGRVAINIGSFTNDMTTFATKDDVLTLLVHLGYLGYCFETKEVYIPNKEVSDEYVNAIRASGWEEVIDSIQASEELLYAIWNGDCETVANGIEKVHNENVSILQYNNENSLSMVVSLSLYSARKYYSIYRELPTGKGFADIVFLPRKKYADKPAIIIELKWNKSAKGAVAQIKEKQYPEGLKEYEGNILLVGINYEKENKKHKCKIEQEKGESKYDGDKNL